MTLLLSFYTTSLRKIQCIFWPRTISHSDLLAWCQQKDKETIITRKWWRWIRQLQHKDPTPSPKLQSTGPRGKVEVWSTKDNLAKNCASGTEEHEPQLGHHPGVEELHCCSIHQMVVIGCNEWNELFFNKEKEGFWLGHDGRLNLARIWMYLTWTYQAWTVCSNHATFKL